MIRSSAAQARPGFAQAPAGDARGERPSIAAGRPGIDKRRVADGGPEESRQPRLAQKGAVVRSLFLAGGETEHQPIGKPDGVRPAARPLNGCEVDAMPRKDGGGNGLQVIGAFLIARHKANYTRRPLAEGVPAPWRRSALRMPASA